ncbi:MAG: pirin family protein, partial [Beijerinckiaceae bacterium]
MSIRPVSHISGTTTHMEGAGVQLERVFGFGDPRLTDPFLMMDDFRNDDPRLYNAGFPW